MRNSLQELNHKPSRTRNENSALFLSSPPTKPDFLIKHRVRHRKGSSIGAFLSSITKAPTHSTNSQVTSKLVSWAHTNSNNPPVHKPTNDSLSRIFEEDLSYIPGLPDDSLELSDIEMFTRGTELTITLKHQLSHYKEKLRQSASQVSHYRSLLHKQKLQINSLKTQLSTHMNPTIIMRRTIKKHPK